MVQAILRGEKTQTRRIIKPQPTAQLIECGTGKKYWAINPDKLNSEYFHHNYGMVGDILWVRETYMPLTLGFAYNADGIWNEKFSGVRWKPSIFMPKEACRIKLKINNIRVERLNDISESDAIQEGVDRWIEERMRSKPVHYKVYYHEKGDESSFSSCPIVSYETLWQSINGEDSWKLNPWVWVIEFERILI